MEAEVARLLINEHDRAVDHGIPPGVAATRVVAEVRRIAEGPPSERVEAFAVAYACWRQRIDPADLPLPDSHLLAGVYRAALENGRDLAAYVLPVLGEQGPERA